MKVVYTAEHLAHDPITETVLGTAIPANEVAERAERIRSTLEADGGFELVAPTEHGVEPITAVHDAGLVRFLEEAWPAARRQGVTYASLAADTYPNRAMFEGLSDEALGRIREPKAAGGRAGFWGLDTAAPIMQGTYGASRWAVDVALTTVDLVLGGETVAYGLCRPPGHHAARSMFGGYCYFNNAAIAAEAIASTTGEPVAIIDVDFHHGNGTQQIFWRRGDVLYTSIHGHPERQYPYFLGYEDERGEGPGAGANVNVPLPAGATDDEYLVAVDRCVAAIGAAKGSIVVVSLGFDTYGQDPIGDFALTTAVYHEVGRRVAALGRRLVILQEGGYHRPSLGENARAWLRGADGRELDLRPATGFGPTGTIAGS